MKERDGEDLKGTQDQQDYSGAWGEGRVKDAGKTMSEGVGPLLMGRSWDPELGDRAGNVGSQTHVHVCVCVYTLPRVHSRYIGSCGRKGGSTFWRASISLRSRTKLRITVWGGEGLGGGLRGSEK